ncbi:helix-turn-helix transcriptional regulator [uncultured Ruminococcus sp.]|uniref:helix-turn-helix domain-containing protein n=1 Tax=uncultured Ruminococcus sp. TaxID=165186 RepID=UPI0029302420|nr:helix-turn-helix transcriptional regulator [uncultured Ruminococcus sp.]
MYRRIRDLREDMDLSQKQVAKALLITQQAYSHYELGTRDIPTDILIKMADFFGTTTDYLLNRTNIK